ncbi:hyalin-like [Strongylocentrotus purpuratus]|uniref:Uncharacterized protein n=1 Tax=Strongylocentrotus purpuratus TaxID=7668 RepID=A0A7M7P7C1_STRPU|nr:hyalin-like [Strongylocentrotus purpuratus]
MAGNVMTVLSFMIGTLYFLVLCQVQSSNAYPSGAVTSACGDMTPNHGFDSQTSVSPYTISVSPAFYQPGQQMNVTISTNTGSPALKGILLQARRTGTDQIIGTWSLADTTGFQTLACNGANSAVTHTTNDYKPAAIQLNWTAPDVDGDDIYVTATFVQAQPVFWVAERTSNIQPDTTLPTITGCPGDITDTALPGDNTLSVTWDEPQASDASGIQSFTPNIQSGFNFPTGQSILVVYTAVDNAGNIQRCGFTVTVNAASVLTTPASTPTVVTTPDTARESATPTTPTTSPTTPSTELTTPTTDSTTPSTMLTTSATTESSTPDDTITTTTPCNPNPCQNGGTCNQRSDTSYTCTCPATHVGYNCDIPAPCNPRPCQNGGVCTVTGLESYSCACPPLYTGIKCQTSGKHVS